MFRPPSTRQALEDLAWTFALGAAFPRLARWSRWPTRLGPRGLLLYILWCTAVSFVARAWLLPALQRWMQWREREIDALRERLGREPTEEEITERLSARYQEQAAEG